VASGYRPCYSLRVERRGCIALAQPAAAPSAPPRRPRRQRRAARAAPGTTRAAWRWTARGCCAARSRRTPRGASRRPRGARCRASRTRRRRCRCRPAWPTPGAARWPARSAARPRLARTCRAGARGRPATLHVRRLVVIRASSGGVLPASCLGGCHMTHLASARRASCRAPASRVRLMLAPQVRILGQRRANGRVWACHALRVTASHVLRVTAETRYAKCWADSATRACH